MIPVNSTPILEEIQQPQVEAMKEDMPAVTQEPQNEEAETQREVQPESTEAAMEVNGMTQNLGAEVQPDESQAPSLGQPTEETTGTTSAWPEWLTGEKPGVVGTSNQPPQQEDRVQIPSSPVTVVPVNTNFDINHFYQTNKLITSIYTIFNRD
jgi:hypothetical protein